MPMTVSPLNCFRSSLQNYPSRKNSMSDWSYRSNSHCIRRHSNRRYTLHYSRLSYRRMTSLNWHRLLRDVGQK